MSTPLLTPAQEDMLKELINISFGLAASIIGDMLQSNAHLVVPTIEVMEVDKLNHLIIEKSNTGEFSYITKQPFKSKLHGESIFVMSEPSAESLARLLFHTQTPSETQIASTVLEITNIITSACIGQLMEMAKSEAFFQPPTVEKRKDDFLTNPKETALFTRAIIIETTLDLQAENIRGHLFILTDEASFSWLREALEQL